MDVAVKLDKKTNLFDTHSALQFLYYTEKDFEKAYFHLNIADSLESTMLNEKKQKIITELELEIEYETKKKEQENKILKKNHTIEKQKGKLKDRMIWSISIGSILLFSIITLLFFKYRQKKRSKERGAMLKIEAFGKEIDLLQATINSRIENTEQTNLSSVNSKELNSSLTDPLSEREFSFGGVTGMRLPMFTLIYILCLHEKRK